MRPTSRDQNNDRHRFVDRKEVLTELDHYKDRVSSGEGRCIFLKGETGVGKTRVAEAFLEECESSGFEVLKSRCLYYESSQPYLPFYEALGEYIERDERKKEEVEEDVGPGFIGQAAATSTEDATPMSFIGGGGEEDEIEETSFSDRQNMMFHRVTDLIIDLSKERPVVFFMDDLHWIDDSSAQLLHHLARNISDERVMLFGAYRPEELRYEEERPPLKDTLDRLKEEKVLDIVELSRLDQHALSELVKEYLGREDLSDDFFWTLYRESEGNPFYAIEIVESLMQEGVIDPQSFIWDPEEALSEMSIPSSIKEMTSRKIEDLEKDEKKVLMYASLLGTEFDFQILERVVDMDVIELLDVVDSLETRGLIEEVERPGQKEVYRFHHTQTKTIINEDMGKSRKRVSHKKIGEILEDFYENELERHYFELSRHFFEGRDYEKAYGYSKKAAENALQGLDIATAIDLFERALKSLRKTGSLGAQDDEEYEVLRRLGGLYSDRNDWDSAKRIYDEMVKRGKKEGNDEMRTRGLIGLGELSNDTGEYEKAEEYFEKALKMCEDMKDLEGIARSYRGIGYVYWRAGEFEKAKAHYQQALEKAREADSDKELALNYLHLAIVYGQMGEHDRSIDHFKMSLPPLKARDSYRQLARAHNNLGDQYMKKEELDKAIEFFDKCVEYAEKIDNKRFMGWGSFNAAEAYTRMGEIEKAAEYLEGVRELMKEIDDEIGLAAVHHIKGMIAQKEGRVDEAIQRYKNSLDIMEDLEVPFNKAEYRVDLGIAYKEKDEFEKAREHLEGAKQTLEEIDAAGKFLDKAEEALEDLPGS
ncbi:MAG: tetratricopeptide repeat protein [Candidatus Aenigmatarchaeota archaeon]